MSTAPFILETQRAQGLILLLVRRVKKSVLLNQAPSSLSWTAAQNIWVQNHIETVTKADARGTLKDVWESTPGSLAGLSALKAHPIAGAFPSAPHF